MKTFRVELQGTTPMLMDNPESAMVVDIGPARKTKKIEEPRVVAERAAYRMADGGLYAPSDWFFRAIRHAAKSYKIPGSRASLYSRIAGLVRVSESQVALLDKKGEQLTVYELDSRPVRSMTGMRPKYRPRIDTWGARFHLFINDLFVEPASIKQCLDDAGQMVGVGSFRLQNGGQFGAFTVVEWREVAGVDGVDGVALRAKKSVPRNEALEK